MYVLRDTAKNTSAKDKSTFILVPKQDDQLLSDKSINLATRGGTEALEEESGSCRFDSKKVQSHHGIAYRLSWHYI